MLRRLIFLLYGDLPLHTVLKRYGLIHLEEEPVMQLPEGVIIFVQILVDLQVLIITSWNTGK